MVNFQEKFKRLMIKEGVSPVPWRLLIILFILITFSTMNFGMVFAYLPQLVKFFGVSEVETGTKVGLLASSLYIYMVLFKKKEHHKTLMSKISLTWGCLADLKGSKLMLIVSACWSILSIILFGFSTSYYMAVLARFLQGAFGGTMVIAKATIFRNCDDTNIFVGMTSYNLALSSGVMLGQAVGGFLAFPAEKYDIFKNVSLFEKFPVLLPNLFVACGTFIAIILVVVFIKNDKRNHRRNKGGETQCLIEDESSFSYGTNNDKDFNDNDVFLDYSIENKQMIKSEKCISRFNLIEPNVIDTVGKINWKQLFTKDVLKNSTFGQLFRNKQFMVTSVLYAMHCLAYIGYEEMLPVFSATIPAYNGFGFNTSQIGLMSMLAALIESVLQIVLIIPIASKITPSRLFIISGTLFMISAPMTPLPFKFMQNRNRFWFGVVGLATLIRTSYVTALTAVSCLMNNSVERHQSGSANGLGLTFAAVGRSIAPSLFGSVYSWSLTNVKENSSNQHALGFPFNQYFAFFLISFVTLINIFIVIKLPKSLNTRIKVLDNVNEHSVKRKTTSVTVSLIKPISNNLCLTDL